MCHYQVVILYVFETKQPEPVSPTYRGGLGNIRIRQQLVEVKYEEGSKFQRKVLTDEVPVVFMGSTGMLTEREYCWIGREIQLWVPEC